MAPRALLLGAGLSSGGHSGLREEAIRMRVWNSGRSGIRSSCRCAAGAGGSAAAETLNFESGRGMSPRQCTYGAVNVLWVASELQRLLSMQVSSLARIRNW